MIYLALFLVGLAFGSFVNAMVWRIHEQEPDEDAKKPANKDPKLSILKGRSMCPHCKHELAAKDLIPVFSWLTLGGKCRYCKKPISAQYPLVEVATGLLFMRSYWAWDLQEGSAMPQDPISFVIWLAMLVGLVALFVYDLKWMILPNRIVFPMIGLAVAYRLSLLAYGYEFVTLGYAALGALMLGGLFYALFAISGGRWIGGGDVKFGIFMGILLGPILAYLSLLIASLLGSVIILLLMAFKVVGRNQQVPFGPFLIAGTYIAMLCGRAIIEWYNVQFLGGML